MTALKRSFTALRCSTMKCCERTAKLSSLRCYQSGSGKRYLSGCLKIAIVKPLHKEGEKSHPKNYRPISLLSILNKILEAVIYERIYEFVKSQLNCQQFGIREKSGTENCLLEMVKNMKLSHDNGNTTSTVFLDLSKAFDTINHD